MSSKPRPASNRKVSPSPHTPLSPSLPTAIDEQIVHRPIQYVTIDSQAIIPDDTVDMILLLDYLGQLRDALAEKLKAKLLDKKVKRARGQNAVAELRLCAVPRVVDTRSCLRAIGRVAEAQQVDLLTMVLRMHGAITIKKEALGDHFSRNDIDAMSVDGDPRAPSMVVDLAPELSAAMAIAAPTTPGAAFEYLLKLYKQNPTILLMPENKKPDPTKNAGVKPRVAYV